MEGIKSFAVGHLTLGYIIGRLTAHATKTKMNFPLILVLSVIPDIDLLIPFIEHRGPLHSAILYTMVFTPLLLRYRRKAFPYFTALIQHPLIGDYFTGGVQIFWPITTQIYGLKASIHSPANIIMELIFFFIALAIIVRTGDIKTMFQPHKSNMILAIPTFTVLLPTFLAFPTDVPAILVPPHILFLTIFLVSSIMGMKSAVPLITD
ncbi:MAG: metal-dependent hydrolase [Nitrososphaerota archaeon]